MISTLYKPFSCFIFFTFSFFQLWLEAQLQQISVGEMFEEPVGCTSSPTRLFVDIVQVSADFIGHLLKGSFAVSTKFLLHQLQDNVTDNLNKEKGRNKQCELSSTLEA